VPEGKKSHRLLWAAITILIILTGLLGYWNSRGERLPEGVIRVKDGNKIIGQITLEEVKKLPAVNKKLVIDSSAGFSKHNFTCIPLAVVFDQLDPHIVKEYKKVITRGTDSYTSGVTMEEVREKNNVFLVYADNGKPLQTKNGGEGTMRVVILNDPFGQRFTNYLVEIELE
jgi:DMSO/TMAO reductase YedYZ molybdopterin-dependent catalytic subunit